MPEEKTEEKKQYSCQNCGKVTSDPNYCESCRSNFPRKEVPENPKIAAASAAKAKAEEEKSAKSASSNKKSGK